MAVASGFPVWVSGCTRRGADLLHVNKLLDNWKQACRECAGEADAPTLQIGISGCYFESLFGVKPQEYIEVVFKDLGDRTQKTLDAFADDDADARTSEEEAVAASGKQRVPWRQWPRCKQGPKCHSKGDGSIDPPNVVMDGAGRPVCQQCQQAERRNSDVDVERGIGKASMEDGIWFVKYRRTIVPLLVCEQCSYGRPQCPEPQWHDGLQDVVGGWACISNQPSFICSRCQGMSSRKRTMEEGEVPLEHFGPGTERDHDSALSGTPLWQLKPFGNLEQATSPDEGMPFPGWELTSDEAITFHDRVCVYFNKRIGKYYVFDQTAQTYIEQLEQPRLPLEHGLISSVQMYSAGGTGTVLGNASNRRCAVVKDLRKAGDLLRTPVPHLDHGALLLLASGLRGPTAADYVAKTLPVRLLAGLSLQRGYWSDERMHDLLRKTFAGVDDDWLSSEERSKCDGCSVSMALHIGDKIHVAGLGAVQVFLSQADGLQPRVLTGQHTTASLDERQRLSVVGGVVDTSGHVHRASEKVPRYQAHTCGTSGDIERVLQAPHAFARLGLNWPLDITSSSIDVHCLRSAYRRQAVRVHPDKVAFEFGHAAKTAFERLSSCCEELEELLDAHGGVALTKLCRLLTATSDEEALGVQAGADQNAVAAAVSELRRHMLLMGDNLEARIGLDRLIGAEKVLSKIAPPSGLMPVSVTRAIGIRDLKEPFQLLTTEPAVTSVEVPDGSSMLALLDPPILEAEAFPVLRVFEGRPRASMLALRQVQQRLHPNENCSCIVLSLKRHQVAEVISGKHNEPNMKKPKLSSRGLEITEPGSVRVRQILLRKKGSPVAPAAVRERVGSNTSSQHRAVTRSQEDAELQALSLLHMLLGDGGAKLFPSLASKHSECPSARKASHLAGDCGWVSRRRIISTSRGSCSSSAPSSLGRSIGPTPGMLLKSGVLGTRCDAATNEYPEEFVSAALALYIYEISDLVMTEQGVHIIQRLA